MPGRVYEEGDKVSVNGLVYQCKADSQGLFCPQTGFEPGTSQFWEQAWMIVGFCDGTTSPVFVTLTDVGGCPAEFDEGEEYEPGDKVSRDGLVYECKPEGAWTVVGYCSGSIGPTSSPVFNPATRIGVCPDAWERGSNVAYEEGDMKAWPFSGFCGQFSPDEFGGSQGWVLAGSCDSSIGPTASPSFDSLAFQAGGCPEEWSATKTDYEAGDQVAYSVSTSPARRIVFQCRTWPNNGYCNQGSGFEPTTKFSNLAWTELGYCDGSMAPTTSPTMYAGTCQFNQCRTTKQSCTAGSAGCSCTAGQAQTSACKVDVETCTMVDVDPWSNSVAYEADDVVRVVRKQFKCKPWPNSLWCPNAAYMPMLEDNGVWPRAWIALDDDCM